MTILGFGDASEYDTFSTTDWKKTYQMGCRFGFVSVTTTGAWKNGKPGLREDATFLTNAGKIAADGIDRMSYYWFDPRKQLTARENWRGSHSFVR